MLEIRTVASLRRNIEMARCRAIGGQNFPLARPTVSFIFGFDGDKWQVYDQVRIRKESSKNSRQRRQGLPEPEFRRGSRSIAAYSWLARNIFFGIWGYMTLLLPTICCWPAETIVNL
jgi:hypothetical protein